MPLKPIAPIFFNSETRQPFSNCLVCDMFLLDPGTEYIIEKSIKQYNYMDSSDIIFEYAICLDCAQRMMDDYSEESKEAIQLYFIKNANHEQLIERLGSIESMDIEQYISHCLFKGVSQKEAEEFQICAHCNGDQINFGNPPFMISGAASEEIMQSLSKQTKGDIDRFIDDYFGGPPEFKELLKDNKFVLF